MTGQNSEAILALEGVAKDIEAQERACRAEQQALIDKLSVLFDVRQGVEKRISALTPPKPLVAEKNAIRMARLDG